MLDNGHSHEQEATPPAVEILEELSPEEQVVALQSLGAGVLSALRCACRYVREYHELVEEDVVDRPELAAYLRRAQEVLKRADRWTGVFDETLPALADYDELDLHILVNGVVKRCQSVAGAPDGVTFECPDKTPALVRGNLFQLQDLLIRLLSMHLPRAGSITVSLVKVPLNQHFLRSVRSPCASGDYAIIAFMLDAPFQTASAEGFLDALVQADVSGGAPEDEALQSRMLPLYGIVKMHGGELLVNRRDARFAALAIILPASRPREEMQAPHNLPSPVSKGDETILLVDDDPDFLDMVMPEMSGSEAFYKLRDIDPGVKVLLSSGYVGEEQVQSMLGEGADGFLEKPYSMETLAYRMRAILDGAPSRSV